MPSHDPVPVFADWDGGIGTIDITPDVTLVEKPSLDLENWWARLGNKLQVITGATSVADRIAISREHGAASMGPDVVSFRPPPHDVTTPEGGHMAAFEDYHVSPIGGKRKQEVS